MDTSILKVAETDPLLSTPSMYRLWPIYIIEKERQTLVDKTLEEIEDADVNYEGPALKCDMPSPNNAPFPTDMAPGTIAQ